MTVLMPPSGGARLSERGFNAFGMERQVADAFAGRVRERICDGRHCWSLRPFTRAERTLGRPIDQRDLDGGRFGYGEDWVVRPIARQDAAAVELHLLMQRPARGLDHAALDLRRE